MNKFPDESLPWPIPMEAVALIANAEGCRLKAYRCPAGVFTIGFGSTEGVRPGMVWTQEQADQRFCDELTSRAMQVMALLKTYASPSQLGALVSLAYNIGVGALAKSSVLRAHNAGDNQAAARAFGLWNKARVNGALVALPGLTARRAAEAALYLKPEPDEPLQQMPQAVESESKMTASPIAQSGAVTAGAGVVGIVTQAGDQMGVVGTLVQQAKSTVVETLGVPADWFLPVVLVAAGGVVIYYRLAQRRSGWA